MPDTTPGPIFIFASGQRCGSTLLQRLLISHPDVMIWGEHDGVLANIFSQFDRLLQWEEMFGHQFDLYQNDGYNNFIPNMSPPRQNTLDAQRKLIENLFKDPAEALGKPIWGFKEVLYGADVAFKLKTLFPTAKIIHLSRAIVDCFISLRHEERITPEMQPHVPVNQVWTRARTVECIDTWVRVNRSMLETPGLDPDWVCHVTYEALVNDPILESHRLVRWLGLHIEDFDIDVYNHKLYTDRHKGYDPRPKITRMDLSEEEIALITTDEILQVSRLLNYDMTVQP